MIKRWLCVMGLAMGLGLSAYAQAPGPTPSQQALEAPLSLDDGKPTQAQPPRPEPSGWRAVGSTILVLGLAGGGLWAFRKWGAHRIPGSGGGRLKVEETLALGDRRFVSILRVDEERFLLSVGPSGVTLLTRLDVSPEPFSEALEQQVELGAPVPIRDMEAMMRGERP